MASDRTRARGATAFHAGHSAEAQVARDYEGRGYTVAHRRWRGRSGELDLVLRRGAAVTFVEVKHSRSFARAAEALGQRQIARLCAAAEEFVAGEPSGQLTEMRLDVALVDGSGAIRIMENALAA